MASVIGLVRKYNKLKQKYNYLYNFSVKQKKAVKNLNSQIKNLEEQVEKLNSYVSFLKIQRFLLIVLYVGLWLYYEF